jgi:hypothetical protein
LVEEKDLENLSIYQILEHPELTKKVRIREALYPAETAHHVMQAKRR